MVFIPAPRGSDSASLSLDQRVLQTTIIAAALIAGQLIFAGIAGVVSITPQPISLLSPLAIGLAALAVPTAWCLRRLLWATAATDGGAPDPARIQAGVIAYIAVLEGANLFNITAWMINRTPAPYVPIIVVLLGIQLWGFPRRRDFEAPPDAGGK
ncbi:MAG: hypothetical protein AAF628_35410 [Planctomycetota bacterium]